MIEFLLQYLTLRYFLAYARIDEWYHSTPTISRKLLPIVESAAESEWWRSRRDGRTLSSLLDIAMKHSRTEDTDYTMLAAIMYMNGLGCDPERVRGNDVRAYIMCMKAWNDMNQEIRLARISSWNSITSIHEEAYDPRDHVSGDGWNLVTISAVTDCVYERLDRPQHILARKIIDRNNRMWM